MGVENQKGKHFSTSKTKTKQQLTRQIPECHETSFCTDGFDVRAGEVLLGADVFVDVDVVRQRHPIGVNVEDAATGFVVRQRKLDLSVNPARTDQGRIQAVDTVGGHDHLHVTTRVKSVELRKSDKNALKILTAELTNSTKFILNPEIGLNVQNYLCDLMNSNFLDSFCYARR